MLNIYLLRRLNYFEALTHRHDLETLCSMAKRHNNSNNEVSDQGPVPKKNLSKDIRKFFSSTPLTTCSRLVSYELRISVARQCLVL